MQQSPRGVFPAEKEKKKKRVATDPRHRLNAQYKKGLTPRGRDFSKHSVPFLPFRTIRSDHSISDSRSAVENPGTRTVSLFLSSKIERVNFPIDWI